MSKRVNLGTSIVENCIIIGLVSLASIGILTTFGGTISETLGSCKIKFKEFQPFGEGATAAPADDTTGNPVDIGVDPNDGGIEIPEIKPSDDTSVNPLDGGVNDINGDPIASGDSEIAPIDDGLLIPAIQPAASSTGPSDPGIQDPTTTAAGAASALGG